MKLEFLTRRGCHLCEDALAVVRRLGIEVAIVDVDSDPVLGAEFDERVPVIRRAGSGEVIVEGVITERDLRSALGG